MSFGVMCSCNRGLLEPFNLLDNQTAPHIESSSSSRGFHSALACHFCRYCRIGCIFCSVDTIIWCADFYDWISAATSLLAIGR
jgi:hypothetical protein